MQTLHRHFLRPCVLLLIVGCSSPLDFGSDTESKAQTYEKYIADGGDAWFNPIGGSDIYHRCLSTRDGYDAWWRFILSENDCDQLVVAVVEKSNGPSDIEWNQTTAYPASWNPDDSPPTWWTRNAGGGAKSFYWCHAAGSAERHHGWYFLYDPQSRTMYVWHWNHQWSSAECTHNQTPDNKPMQRSDGGQRFGDGKSTPVAR